MVRALTAQAWAVACALFKGREHFWNNEIERVAQLPAPADLAAGFFA